MIRFAVVGVSHFHILDMVAALIRAGGELVAVWGRESEFVSRLAGEHGLSPVDEPARIFDDPSVQLIVTSDIPDQRAGWGVRAMRQGKDFFSDKPGFTTIEQLEEARRVQAETGRIYAVYYGRLQSPATMRAAKLVHSGAIGRVVQTLGLGPHRANPAARPAWFFERQHYGGILTDIGVHEVEEFLYFTGSTRADIVAAQVANYRFPEYPELEDFGDVTLRGDGGAGYFRVDWYTPDGLGAWGDTRTFLLGTEGYIEVRKNVDLEGRPGGEHLFLVDRRRTHYIDCSRAEAPYVTQLLSDIRNRTNAAMAQEHCFLASEIALRAEMTATRFGYLR